MRCSDCGAQNPAGAQWCGQCYATFAARDTPAAAPAAEPEAPDAATTPAAAGGSAAERAGFRRREGGVEWRCVTCGEFNSLADRACRVCGTALSARFEEPAPDPGPASWGAALVLSAVLPGAGHYLAGRGGSGIARAVLYVVWLAGGLLLLLGAGALAAFAAVPLLLGALIVWAGTLLDVASLRGGNRELLTGRVLLWLVVGVTVLLLLGAFGGAARIAR